MVKCKMGDAEQWLDKTNSTGVVCSVVVEMRLKGAEASRDPVRGAVKSEPAG